MDFNKVYGEICFIRVILFYFKFHNPKIKLKIIYFSISEPVDQIYANEKTKITILEVHDLHI